MDLQSLVPRSTGTVFGLQTLVLPTVISLPTLITVDLPDLVPVDLPVVVLSGSPALDSLPECSVAPSIPTFDPSSNQNVAVYYGQGYEQDRLVNICQNGAYDIINVGFINKFPDDSGYPGADFGNQCGAERYEGSDLPSNCPYIGEDIKTCQDVYGKKVFLSIGGAIPNDYYLKDTDYAKSFAEFLWKAFGPPQNDGSPRPFGDAIVDGFDFDIESEISTTGAPADYRSQFYPDMINHFHDVLFYEDPSNNYYISGAPQCLFPDSHLAEAFKNSWFDFMFIQFYNTPQCAAFLEVIGISNSLAQYVDPQWISTLRNPNVKVFAGLPASASAAVQDGEFSYLYPNEVYNWLVPYQDSSASFGGVMLWEATFDERVKARDGYQQSEWVKSVLVGCSTGDVMDLECSFFHYKPNKAQLAVSTTGKCGDSFGFTCEGSVFGNCCSQYGNCGSVDGYCGSGCDIRYGLCGNDANAAPTCTSSTSITPTPTPAPPVETPVNSPADTPVFTPTPTPVYTPADTPIYTPADTLALTPIGTPVSTPIEPVFTPIEPVFTPVGPVFTPVGPSFTPVDTPAFTPINPALTPIATPALTPIGPAFTPVGPAFVPVDTPASTPVDTPVFTPISPVFTPVDTPIPIHTPPVLSPSGNLTCHLSTPGASVPASGPTGSSSSVTPGITSAPKQSGSAAGAEGLTTTVITTTYIDVCPTGLTKITTTYTTTGCPSQTSLAIPSGWITAVTVCNSCGPMPTTLTLTRPILTSDGPAVASSALTTSTVYATQLFTITACPPSVTDCPASSKTHVSVATSFVPISTTMYSAPPAVTSSLSTAKTMVEGGHQSGQASSQSGISGQSGSGRTSSASGAFSTSTVYQTQLLTITACPPSVRNCPASEQITTVVSRPILSYMTVVPAVASATPVDGSGSTGSPVPSAGVSSSSPAKQVYGAGSSSSSSSASVSPVQSGIRGGSGSGSGSGSPFSSSHQSASSSSYSSSPSSPSIAIVVPTSEASSPSSASAVGGAAGSNTNANTNSPQTSAVDTAAAVTTQLLTVLVVPMPASSSFGSSYYPASSQAAAAAAAYSSLAPSAAPLASSAPAAAALPNYNNSTTAVYLNIPLSPFTYGVPTPSASASISVSTSVSGSKTATAASTRYTGGAASVRVGGLAWGLAAIVGTAVAGLL